MGSLDSRTRPASSVAKQRVADGQSAASSPFVPMPAKLTAGPHGPEAGLSETKIPPCQSAALAMQSCVPAQASGLPKSAATAVGVHVVRAGIGARQQVAFVLAGVAQ